MTEAHRAHEGPPGAGTGRAVQFAADSQGLAQAEPNSWPADYPHVTLRAYGAYDGSVADLVLGTLPHVRRFSADALCELQSIDGLEMLPADLEYLGLGQTRRRLPLSHLARPAP